MPPTLRRLGWVGSLMLVAVPASADGKPHLDWSKDIWCITDHRGQEFRVQDEQLSTGGHRLLVAPNEEATGKPLERVATCKTSNDWAAAVGPEAARAPRVSAVAEAPPGWYRDEQGRVFQVSFDLMRRFYLGAGWQPTFDPAAGKQHLNRAYVDMGLDASWLHQDSRTRHTIRAAQGYVTFDDLRVDGTLFSYELVHASTTPLLRFTTFFGTPQRYDTKMDMGFGLRVLKVEHRPHGTDELVDVEMGETHLAWYPWHSADLFDYVRITAGGAAGGLYQTGARKSEVYRLGPQGAVQAYFNLDSGGFHYLDASVRGAVPVTVDGQGHGSSHYRAGAEAGYEVIFLAVNDQPLSLRVKAGLDWRDDLPDGIPKLEGSVFTGMRFSFWAPARDRTPLRYPYALRAMNDTGSF